MFNHIYQGKTVLVTGHTGFKGAWITAWLLKLGAKVVGISIDIPTSPSLFEELDLAGKITDYRKDVRAFEAVKEIILNEKPDFVFHLAAQPIVSLSYSDPVNTFSTNVMGTVHVMEALRSLQNPCTAIIITSDKCYDNVEWVWGYKETDAVGGKDIYSGSKGAAEVVFKSYYHSFFKDHPFVKIASARAGNVIGGGDWAKDRIVPDCMNAWYLGKSVEIRSPESTRPWQHVLEPISGYLNLGQKLSEDSSLHGESFNFGPKSEHSHTVKVLLEDLSAHWNFEDTSKAYNITDNIRFHEAGLLKLNCDKSLFFLKWIPTLEYQELIAFTSLWYYEFYHENKGMWSYTLDQIDRYETLAKQKQIKWTF
ncbi:CDP-glucose 4,6-dehydratase [Pedobacter steynii]|uniref:CDP-glucose 4,6-dehydratase n=1 Tax=Pedobacter steynii TaxID=430522 RepID=A0A1G9WHM5_9SPHI|nr:CDP-glucose 4,6-dehydratase [Pedobacter steynii]NQX40301.1 CDP-glucose 4,6-dehydratase [Pedobacter steynii]SDM84034.1 CDP-glucose 4,6-dehydratase [Pedobacter steynii]